MPVRLGSKVLVDRDVCWLGQDWYLQYRRQEQSRGASAPPTVAFGPTLCSVPGKAMALALERALAHVIIMLWLRFICM